MAQSLQSTPTVSADIGGSNHQVNLRDYLNIRVAPFLKKAITESLEASPEFPLQWLGENLIHQSMLYEGNPDRTNIREKFLYKFEAPVAAPTASAAPVAPMSSSSEVLMETQTDPVDLGLSSEPAPTDEPNPGPETASVQDAQMSTHINGSVEAPQEQQQEGLRDTEMEGTT